MIERWLDWEQRLQRGREVMKKMGLIYPEIVKIGEQVFPIFDTAEGTGHGRAYQFKRIQHTGTIVATDFFGATLGFVEINWRELWDHPGAVVRASDSREGNNRFDEVRISLAVARIRAAR